MKNADIAKAMTIKLEFPNGLPPKKPFQEGIRRAPDRGFRLSPAQTELALKNALRYILAAVSMAIVSARKAASMANQLMNIKENARKAKLSRS